MPDKIDYSTTRIYAIGDIHGRSDLLDRVIENIHRDLQTHPANAITVTLGDYVDRGPDSRGVIDRLARNPFPTPYVALKGNHEDLLNAFLRDPSLFGHWLRLGGLETLHSYGVPAQSLLMERNAAEVAAQFHTVLPAEHMAFLSSLKTSLDAGGFFLCHAGIRPGVPFDRQEDHDLIWIRHDFLDSRADHGKLVVHGHTPVERPEVLPNRINIDTAAYVSGRLTCVVLENGKHRFLMD